MAMVMRRTPLVGVGGDAGAAAPMSMTNVTTSAAAAVEAGAADKAARR